LALRFRVRVRGTRIDGGEVHLELGLRRLGLLRVEGDGGVEALEAALHGHAHLLDDERDGALLLHDLLRLLGERRRRGGDEKRGEGGSRESHGLRSGTSMRRSTASRSMKWCLSAAATCSAMTAAIV